MITILEPAEHGVAPPAMKSLFGQVDNCYLDVLATRHACARGFRGPSVAFQASQI